MARHLEWVSATGEIAVENDVQDAFGITLDAGQLGITLGEDDAGAVIYGTPDELRDFAQRLVSALADPACPQAKGA